MLTCPHGHGSSGAAGPAFILAVWVIIGGLARRAGVASVLKTIMTNGSVGRLRLVPTYVGMAAIMGAAILAAVAAVGGGAEHESTHGDRPLLSVAAPSAVILKSDHVLHLFDGDALVRTYAIDLGTSPVGPKRREGDGRTPEGIFRVVTKNADSPYHRFIGISYPDLDAVEWGFARGLVSPGQAASIRRALVAGQCPDWRTALGGGIGVHGRRIGRDWTGGCIAVSNEHIEELFSVLRIGDPIEILP